MKFECVIYKVIYRDFPGEKSEGQGRLFALLEIISPPLFGLNDEFVLCQQLHSTVS